MALISDNQFKLACNGNRKQLNCYSQTSLLTNRINFKSSQELSPNGSDEDDILSIKKFHNKYNVLVPETSCKLVRRDTNNNNNNNNHSSRLSNEKQHHQTTKEIDNELGEPKHVLFSPNKVLLDWKKISKIGSGLSNLGNTCFMNSVLQSLTYCPPLVNYLFANMSDHSCKCHLNFCMICLLYSHVDATLNRKNGNVHRPNNIAHRLKSIARHFSFGRQEDAHEFLRYVIDHMWRAALTVHEKEMGMANTSCKFDHLTKATTAINQIFGGYHRSQVSCFNCKAKSNTYDYFMDFMLDIHNVNSLEEALKKFVTPEILKNENAYKCSNCKKSVAARKQFSVYKAPNVATFQFKRFDCTRVLNGKITRLITYPEKLNLRPYMSESTGPPIMYKLMSVLIHLGTSTSSGHYFCYVRNSNNCWYLMDDAHVSQVNLNQVLNQKAYVLFYIKQTGVANNTTLPPFTSLVKPLLPNPVPTVSPPSANNHHPPPHHQENGTTNSLPSIVIQRKPLVASNIEASQTVTLNKDSLETVKIKIDENNHKEPVVKEAKEEKTEKVEKKKETVKIVEQPYRSIPVIKVKAITNSWHVVENKRVDGEESLEAKDAFGVSKEWRISDTSMSPPEGEKTKETNATDAEERERKSKESKKRKHKKRDKEHKDKEKKKKKLKLADQDEKVDGDNHSEELSWVERTKETLEMEKKDEEAPLDIKLKAQVNQEVSNKKTDILDALLKGASQGYGQVKTWNGSVSKLSVRMEHNNNSKSKHGNGDDEYNDEFDRGKTKKMKHHHHYETHQQHFNNRFAPYDRSAAPWGKRQQQQHRKGTNTFDRHMKDYHNSNHQNRFVNKKL